MLQTELGTFTTKLRALYFSLLQGSCSRQDWAHQLQNLEHSESRYYKAYFADRIGQINHKIESTLSFTTTRLILQTGLGILTTNFRGL